jgi:sugar phosphate permease
MFIPPWYQPFIGQPITKPTTKLPYMKLQYPTYVKDTNSNAHIRIFKKAIKTNGEIMEVDIINLFGFIFRDNIFEWGKNYVQNHPNYIFEEPEFCKRFRTIKNNEKVYM